MIKVLQLEPDNSWAEGCKKKIPQICGKRLIDLDE